MEDVAMWLCVQTLGCDIYRDIIHGNFCVRYELEKSTGGVDVIRAYGDTIQQAVRNFYEIVRTKGTEYLKTL